MPFRVLTDDDVRESADMRKVVAVIQRALIARADGTLVCPPRHSVEFPKRGSLVFTMGGVTGQQSLAGFRVYDTFGGDSPDGAEVAVVWDSSTGALKGLVVGELLGAIRTGAIGGAAVNLMARKNASKVAVIGTGLQARTQLEATAAVRSLSSVKVFSRSPERRTQFAAELSASLSLNITAVDSAQAAVSDADIVLCATTSNDPVIKAEWLAPGTHVNTVGPKYQGAHELDLATAAVAEVIATDSPQQIGAYGTPFFLTGTPQMKQMLDLAQIASGKFEGRKSDAGITLFCSVGLAGTEVLVADALL